MAYKKLNKKNLLYNVKYFKSIIPINTLFCAVVKSNAYGHGIDKVVKVIDKYVDYYAVTSCDEGAKLRELTDKNILVLRGFKNEEIEKFSLCDLEVAVLSGIDIEKIKNIDKNFKVHIAINSGMNRLGIKSNRALKQIIKNINNTSNIKLVGVFSHISDYEKKRRVKGQISNFNSLINGVDKKVLRHISNSGTSAKFPEYALNMCRIGIGLYGYENKNLRPVMEVYATIIDKQIVRRGEYVGYGSKARAKDNLVVAIIDIGYADGLPRIYGKKGCVIINNNLCKIIGNICMSMTIVDVTNINCKVGDNVIIIGESLDYKITAEDIAKDCKTISYEILTNFTKIQLSH